LSKEQLPSPTISNLVIEAIRARLDAGSSVAHLGVLSGTESSAGTADGAIESASITTRSVAVPSRGRFLLYSITKTVMAVAALRLVQEGRLDLDGPLSPWLPDFPPARGFSLRQILQHTSGLPDYGPLKLYHDAVRRGDTPWTEDEFLARTEATRLRSAPGSVFAYSNIGYMLLRRVLVRASGQDFTSLLHRAAFAPAGIDDATVPATKGDLSAFTLGPSRYLGSDNEPADVAQRYDPAWIAHGVAGTSVVSAIRFLHALFCGELLAAEPLSEMAKGRVLETPDTKGPWQRPAYGLGLMIPWDHAHGGPGLGHRGGGPGCSPALFHFPRKRKPLTVCVITNGEDSDLPVAMVKAVADTFA
jgi:CubicO group peptidase (beta-lactamase class C family)